MKTVNQILVTVLCLLFFSDALAQQTIIKISDYQYSTTFNDGKCAESLSVTAHFLTGEAPRTFMEYTNGNTSAADRDYVVQGTVSKLVVVATAKDQVDGGRLFGCFRSQEEVTETYEIPIDPSSCEVNTIGERHALGGEVTQEFSFQYQVITKVGVSGKGAFSVSNDAIGYEEPFSLAADAGFDENTYQWQYSIATTEHWINVPRAPSEQLEIRLIDFLEESIIDQEVSFRIASCDATYSDQTVVTRMVKNYEQLTRININDYNYTADYDNGRCEDEIRFTAHFEDGRSPQQFIRHRNQRTGTRADRAFVLEGVVTRIDVYIYGKDKAWLPFKGSFCGRGSFGGRVIKTYRRDLEVNPCATGSFDERQSDSNNYIGGYEVRQRLRFTYKITPLPKITRTTPTDFMGYEDEFELQATSGFKDSVYDWQYGIVDGSAPIVWQDLAGASSATRAITLADYFEESIIGQELVFRTTSCDGIGSQNVISYEVRRSAARIQSVATTPVSCYDAQDGTVTITFDRPLVAGDVFSFSITDQSLPEGNVVATANNITAFDRENKLTISGLPPSSADFLLAMIGANTGEPYYTDAPYHSANFQIGRPTPVAFVGEPKDAIVNVRCHGGQDGEITLNAAGGAGDYEYAMSTTREPWDDRGWTAFAAPTTHTITGLLPNTYYIKIRDANTCVAKEQALVDGQIALREERIESVEITQPLAPLTVTTEILNRPTAYDFEDARIMATVTGGTPRDDDSYTFEWKDENGVVISTTDARDSAGQGYLITAHSIGAGSYTLTVKDANYEGAIDKNGCTVVTEIVTVTQPDALQIRLEVVPISCNAANEHSTNIDTNFDGIADQFQDGVITATVTGGVVFDLQNPNLNAPYSENENGDLLPYFYHWKIQNNDGRWRAFSRNTPVIDFLDTATNYSLNVTDSNGITIGSYTAVVAADGSQNYELSEAIDSIIYVSQPEVLALDFDTTIASCANGNDATASAQVTGGVAPYTYEWSTDDTTACIENLTAGIYVVYITDAKGCQIEGTVTVEHPNQITIDPTTVVAPTCFEGNDGQIALQVTGGNPPYTYSWDTGAQTNQLTNLKAGTYRLEVTDANGCKAFYEEILVDPEPVLVNLIEKRDLCQAQFVELDIAIDDPKATYSWASDTGFTSADSDVILDKTGVYTATITNGLGCVGVGTIVVTAFDIPIDADFLITTQAYTEEEVMLVNVSSPIGDNVTWTIPEGAELVVQSEDGVIVKFAEAGTYEIHMRSHQGQCYQDFTKTVLVQPGIEGPVVAETADPFIEEFILYPNPNTGTFNTKISLAEISKCTVKIMDLRSGAVMEERTGANGQGFLLDYSVSLPSGVYLMLLETPKASETRKLIIK